MALPMLLTNQQLLLTKATSSAALFSRGIRSTVSDSQTYTLQTLPHTAVEFGSIYMGLHDPSDNSLWVVRDSVVIQYDLNSAGCLSSFIFDPSESSFRKISISDNYILIAGRRDLILLDKTTKNRVDTAQNSGYWTAFASAHLSSGGSALARVKVGDSGSIEVVSLPSLTVTHTLSRYTSTNYGGNIYLSATGQYIVYATTSSQTTIYDLVNNSIVDTITFSSNSSGVAGYIETEDDDYVIGVSGKSGSNSLVFIKLSTGQVVQSLSMPSSGIAGSITRIAGNRFIIQSSDVQYTYEWDTVSETLSHIHTTTLADMFVYPKLDGVEAPYKIEDTISETVYTDDFTVTSFDLVNNAIVDSRVIQAGAFTILYNTTNPIRMTVTPFINKGICGRSETMAVGDLVYSDNPKVYDWIYKCVVAGTTNTFSPTWPTTAGIQFVDGTVTWEVVEPISAPISKEPLVPEPM